MISQIIMAQRIVHALSEFIPQTTKDALSFSITVSTIFQVAGGFVLWGLSTGIITCISILFDGKGDFKKLLELIAYSHLPLLLYCVIGLSLAVSFKPHFELDPDRAKNDKEYVAQTIRDGLFKSGVFRFSTALNSCFFFWAIILIVLSIHICEKLSYAVSISSVLLLALLYGVALIIRNNLMIRMQ